MKMSYEFVHLQVEKMYAKEFDEKDTTSIEEHCEKIAAFIVSCGWTEEEYIERYCNDKADVN